MKNLKTIGLFLYIVCFFGNNIFAQSQQQTAYEKKKESLALQMMQKFGQRTAQLVWNTLSEKTYDEVIEYAKEAEQGAKLAAAYGRNEPGFQAIIWYANELKKIQNLRTSVDVQREKQATYEKTNAGAVQKKIKTAFEKWNQKGEFEIKDDYEKRLQNQSKDAFIQTYAEQIENNLPNYNGYNVLQKELQPYNADNGFFTVNFKINGIEWQSKITIPITDAENFKNNWRNMNPQINKYDWCFIENMLCPTLITLSDKNNKYEFPSSLQNKSEITFAFDDLKIDNPYLKGYTFRYSEAKAIELKIAQEKFVSDSLETVSYNNKLETAFQDYNRQLLEHKYNIEKNVISNYAKIPMGNNKEKNYENSLNSLKHDYNRINSEMERTFNLAYSYAKEFFSTKEDFEKFYTQGKDVLNEEIAKRKQKQEEENILIFFKSNAKFIESMDFQKEKKESTASTIGKGLYGVTTGTNVSARDYTNENEVRKKILSTISESQNKPYYSQILDFVIETNKRLNKEWNKNGQFFTNKSNFFDSYLMENYKDILKTNKKK